MNIIAGERKGTVLAAPQGLSTRPTQAKVRESLFNMIQGFFTDAIVLDLFAGSGALALEALSRGAQEARCVDCSRDAAKMIRQNIAKLHYEDRCQLLNCDYHHAISTFAAEGIKFDLVFLDPPYRMDVYAESCSLLADQHLLNDEAILILEHSKDFQEISDIRFQLFKKREYGETIIHFYQFFAERNS